MSFQVIPVPEFGAEDVVVGTQGAGRGRRLHRHRGRQHLPDLPRRQRRSSGWRRPAAGRSASRSTSTDGCWSVTPTCGVLRIDTGSGAVETVTDSVAGRKMVFCNNAAIGSDGTVWFSDSSTKYGVEQWKDDFVQNTRTGRLLQLSRRGRGRGGARRPGVRQRGRALAERGLRRRGRVRRAHRRTPMADRQPRRDARPAVPEPAGLPRQHRPRQRRADLGDDRQPHRPARRASPEVARCRCARR